MKFLISLILAVSFAGCASKKMAPAIKEQSSQLKVSRVGPDASLREYFKLSFPACTIVFEVTSKRDKSSFQILINDQCENPRPSRAQEYTAILSAVFKVYPKENFDSLSSHSFYRLHLWEEKIALACIKSEKWTEFQANRNKVGVANTVFTEIFNDAGIGEEIRAAFLKEDMNIQLARVEKVMEAKAKSLPFAANYPELKDSNRRVAFAAGLYVFRMPQ